MCQSLNVKFCQVLVSCLFQIAHSENDNLIILSGFLLPSGLKGKPYCQVRNNLTDFLFQFKPIKRKKRVPFWQPLSVFFSYCNLILTKQLTSHSTLHNQGFHLFWPVPLIFVLKQWLLYSFLIWLVIWL
ncbi:hypothetical protein EV198_0481 [Roseivirga ehrenbergii]|nr:hypothetical protein EV198_0481 [Roseivirga ehrenbergii]